MSKSRWDRRSVVSDASVGCGCELGGVICTPVPEILEAKGSTQGAFVLCERKWTETELRLKWNDSLLASPLVLVRLVFQWSVSDSLAWKLLSQLLTSCYLKWFCLFRSKGSSEKEDVTVSQWVMKSKTSPYLVTSSGLSRINLKCWSIHFVLVSSCSVLSSHLFESLYFQCDQIKDHIFFLKFLKGKSS